MIPAKMDICGVRPVQYFPMPFFRVQILEWSVNPLSLFVFIPFLPDCFTRIGFPPNAIESRRACGFLRLYISNGDKTGRSDTINVLENMNTSANNSYLIYIKL